MYTSLLGFIEVKRPLYANALVAAERALDTRTGAPALVLRAPAATAACLERARSALLALRERGLHPGNSSHLARVSRILATRSLVTMSVGSALSIGSRRQRSRHNLQLFAQLFALFLLALLLTGCARQAEFPRYPDIERTLDASKAVTLGAQPPVFGSQLRISSGSYYVVTGDSALIQSWYERLVAEQQLEFVAERDMPDGLHRLYRVYGPSIVFAEVAVRQLQGLTCLLAIYSGVPQRLVVSTDNWLRKAWGFILGRSERSASDVLFGLLTGIVKPIRPIYEKLWVEPVLNILLALRWLLRWNFGVLVIFFALCLAPITGFVTDLLRKPVRNSKAGLIVTGILIFLLTSVFLATAIWEVLNAFYDTSSTSQAWLSTHIYPFWSQNLRQLAATPPGGAWLRIRLDQPNLLVVPLLAVLATLIAMGTRMSNAKQAYEIVKKHRPDKADRFLPAASWAEDEEKQFEEDGCSYILAILREGAVLAFLPLGVALYFLTDKCREAFDQCLDAWDLTAAQKRLAAGRPIWRPSSAVRWLLRGGVVLALGGWLFLGAGGALLRNDVGSRVIGLFVSEAKPASSLVSSPQDPLATPQAGAVSPTPPAAATATSAPITPSTSHPTTTPIPAPRGVVTVKLNLRSGPGTNFPIVGGFQSGAELRLLGRNGSGDWLYVTHNNAAGWVSASYVDANIRVTDLPVR